MPRVAACPDVRQAVLDAAALLMERYGYKKMTIDDISSEIGIGKATLYGYFHNKQDVALAVIEGYHQDIQTRWLEIIAQPESAPEKLRLMIQVRVMYLFDVASRHRQSLDDCLAQLRPLVLTKRDHYNEVEAGILTQVLRQGLEEGSFRFEDENQTAHAIIVCSGGLMPLNLSPRELASRDEVLEKTRVVTNFILRGVGVDARKSELERERTAVGANS